MKRVIVSTTINPPTEAIELFDAMPDWELVVIGDRRTPADYHLKRGLYVTPRDQELFDKRLSDAIGWNCIARRNFGLLWAYEILGADVIALVDDDNIPYSHWGQNLMVGRDTASTCYWTKLPVFDPVGVTNYPELWHRGYPLEFLPKRTEALEGTGPVRFTPLVQADFWCGDPDIDAICRMEHAPECTFDSKYFPLSSNRMSPFNSQNTFLAREVLSDYFLFPHVGRMEDIWASYYYQAKTGHRPVYGRPSVYQKRNEHDLTKDLHDEVIGYENNLKLVHDLMVDPARINWYLPASSARAFDLYQRRFR